MSAVDCRPALFVCSYARMSFDVFTFAFRLPWNACWSSVVSAPLQWFQIYPFRNRGIPRISLMTDFFTAGFSKRGTL